MPSDEFIVLACSLKKTGRCVAGISTRTKQWVRPVSTYDEGQLGPYQYLIDGREPKLLDIVECEHQGPTGDPAQPENVLVGDEPLRLAGRVDPDEAYERLTPHLAEGPELFGNIGASVPEAEAEAGVACSLALIEPQELSFELREPWGGRSRASPRAHFELDGCAYDIGLTDRIVRPRLFKAGYGIYSPADLDIKAGEHTLLTASLGGAFKQAHWKLAAAVVFLP
ncbi:MAG TPA: hypothetical protein VFX45_09550 [Solirubrobacterales bacterium]|nr:hypothetical protein [Solirubrobacterales bacterium]